MADMADRKAAAPPLWRSAFSGSVGGVCCTLVGHPFDTVKVRIQTGFGRQGLYSGLYSGVLSPIVAVSPFWVLSFFSYRAALRAQDAPGWQREDAENLGNVMRAGMASGLASGGIRGIADNIKGNAQIRGTSAGAAVRFLYAQGGIRALCRGMSATTIYSIPTQAVYYATYEYANRELPSEGRFANELLRAFTSGCLAGLFEWSSGMPLDVIRQRIYNGEFDGKFMNTVRGVYRAHGIRGFYLGLVPTLLRAVPANGAAFIGITQTERWLARTLGES